MARSLGLKLDSNQLQELYWNQRLGQREIAQKLGCTRKNITYWMKKLNIKVRSRPRATSLGRSKPNLSLSPSLAYILGVLKGDATGACYPKWHYNVLQLIVNDKAFVNSFSNALRKIGLNPRVTTVFRYGKNRYVARGFSLIFVSWYKKLSLDEIEKIVTANAECSKEFIRGFYESEGHFGKYPRQHINHIHRNWQLCVDHTNKKLLDLVRRLVKKLGFKFSLLGPYYRKNPRYKPEYRLNLLGGQGEIRRFLELINPCIKDGGLIRG